MVGIVLASHGTFAEGILMSAQMIFGNQENIKAITLMPEKGPDDFRAGLTEAIAGFENQDQVLFLVDLQGGTPWNQVTMLMEQEHAAHPNWVALGGMNLPMLISALGARLGVDNAEAVAKEALPEAQSGIVSAPEDLICPSAPANTAGKAAPVAKANSIPEGTVLGDGHIKIALARIDTRLLHGQVAVAWSKALNPDRIIVVSNAVAQDELRKSMIEQAAPPGVRAHVVPIKKMIEIANDPRFGATKALLLFETPQDLLDLVEGGVEIKEANLGSIAHSVGKAVLTNAIAMDRHDLDAIKALMDKGVTFNTRKVPTDAAGNFAALIKKAEAEIH